MLSFWLTGVLTIMLHMAPMSVDKHQLSKVEWLAYLRSQAEKATFAKAHPCPLTHKPVMSCKGYVIDHIKPLCDGGPDKASNMQWQTDADSYKKDAIERRVCACHKAGHTSCGIYPWAIK
jgi:hypothetical protein